MRSTKVSEPKGWLFFEKVYAIDGKKLGDVQAKLQKAREELAQVGNQDPKAALEKLSPQERAVLDASIQGDRHTLVADSFIPATMAAIYLLILLYFKTIGGYKPVHIVAEKPTGGVQAPVT